jgi:drug/metabolite transporter (DMT)-like permease
MTSLASDLGSCHWPFATGPGADGRGVAVATVGLGLLTLEHIELSLNRGDVLTLICALVFAFHILFVGRYVTDANFRQLVALQVSGSALLCTIMLPLGSCTGSPARWPPPP